MSAAAMEAALRLGGRLLAATSRRAVRSRAGTRLNFHHYSPGAWNQSRDENLRNLKEVTNWRNQLAIFTLLGISVSVSAEEMRSVKAEEACPEHQVASHHSAPKDDVAVTSVQGEELKDSKPVEVASNVHTAKWRVFTDMGRDLFSKGRLDESEKFLVQALEEAKQGFGEKDPHVASSCNNLAELHRMKGHYAEAEALFLEAIDRLEKAFYPSHVSVSFTLHNLAGTYLIQRKFGQARQCYERSLEIKEKELGRNHPEYASTLFHLGEVLRSQGELADAEKLIRESVDILQEGGAGHTLLAMRRMGRLVEILSQTGQLKEAEKLQRKILHHLELSQGVESSNTTTAAENLATTLQAVGKLDEAEELLQRSLEVRQKTLPPNHMQLGVSMFKLASVSMHRGAELASAKTRDVAEAKLEYERAEELLRRAIMIAERSWKPVADAPSLAPLRAGVLVSLLRSMDAMGRLEVHKSELATTVEEMEKSRRGAEAMFRRCLSVLDKPGVERELGGVPEFQRQHIACLRHLANLLGSTPDLDTKEKLRNEVDQLLRKLALLEAELRKKEHSVEGTKRLVNKF